MTINERLKEIRLESGQSQRQLGEKLGMNYTNVSAIERGVKPSDSLAERWAEACGYAYKISKHFEKKVKNNC